MVGQAGLRECLLDPGVEAVLTVGRSATGVQNAKLREIVHSDLLNYTAIESELAGWDACFFCLGVSSGGMAPELYERLTYGIAVAAGQTLSRLNPGMTFVYVSGMGTDTSEQGRVRWARVKGRTENTLLRLFPAAYMFRPAVILATHGERSRTEAYRVAYNLTKPVLPLLRRLFPKYFITTEEIARAMLNVTRHGYPKRILESADIRDAGQKRT